MQSRYHFGDDAQPLLATAIHAGHLLPLQLEEGCGISEADRLREEDPHTGEFAGLFANRIIVDTSRFAVDLNRDPAKAVYLAPEDCWGLNVRSRPLSSEALATLRADYQSWYAVLEYQIDRLLRLHPQLTVLDLHSYNHRRGGPEAAADPQAGNPDIIIGRSNLQACHYPAAEALRACLDGQSYLGQALDCRADVKFTGGHLSRWLNARYTDRLICLAIEFKKTFMDEWSGKLHLAAFTDLKALFRAGVRKWLTEYRHTCI